MAHRPTFYPVISLFAVDDDDDDDDDDGVAAKLRSVSDMWQCSFRGRGCCGFGNFPVTRKSSSEVKLV
jgi:hypothetical protein